MHHIRAEIVYEASDIRDNRMKTWDTGIGRDNTLRLALYCVAVVEECVQFEENTRRCCDSVPVQCDFDREQHTRLSLNIAHIILDTRTAGLTAVCRRLGDTV